LILIQRGCLLSRIIHQIVGGTLGEYVGVFVAEGVAEGEEAMRYLIVGKNDNGSVLNHFY